MVLQELISIELEYCFNSEKVPHCEQSLHLPILNKIFLYLTRMSIPSTYTADVIGISDVIAIGEQWPMVIPSTSDVSYIYFASLMGSHM